MYKDIGCRNKANKGNKSYGAILDNNAHAIISQEAIGKKAHRAKTKSKNKVN
jgi:hypothetical protein